MTIAANIGDMAILTFNACFPDSIVGFVPEKETALDFLFYIFVAMKAELLSTAVLNTQLNLNILRIESMPTACPPFSEQIKIAGFLDEKIAQIDRLTEKKQALIEKLNEKRTAMITQAVTKGLDENVPMKDSGVEWLGEVPVHWTVARIKNISKLESGHTPDKKKEEYWVDCDIDWVSLNDSKYLAKYDYISETTIKINRKGLAGSSARILPKEVVVFTRDASIGFAAITTKEMAVSQHLIAWVCDKKIVLPEFLLFIFYGMEKELERYTFGATIKTIGMPDVKKLIAAFPPIKEQKEIIKYVFESKESIEAQIEKTQMVLDRLKEYRTATITAAVTGKIDVRNFKPNRKEKSAREAA